MGPTTGCPANSTQGSYLHTMLPNFNLLIWHFHHLFSSPLHLILIALPSSDNDNQISMALLENRKGKAITAAAIDLCLKKLQLDYVDLVCDLII